MKKKIKRLTVKQKNDAFQKLSAAEKRITIANDVISQLNSGKLIATTGLYVGYRKVDGEVKPETELKTLFDKSPTCEACGIGALFVCMIKRVDKLKICDVGLSGCECADCIGIINQEDIHSYLKKYFTIKQLEVIENAFEHNYYYTISDDLDSGLFFEDLSISSKIKLKLIMQNIINNKGIFKYTKKYRPVLVKNKWILPQVK